MGENIKKEVSLDDISTVFVKQEESMETMASYIKSEPPDQELYDQTDIDIKMEPLIKEEQEFDTNNENNTYMLLKAVDDNGHPRRYAGEKLVECRIPTNRIFLLTNTNLHVQTRSENTKFKCDMCNKTFDRKQLLDKHMVRHTGAKPYTCMVCNKKYTVNSTLQNHMRTHTGERLCECKICKRKFAVNHTLKQHMMTHTGEKPFVCKVCDKKFTRKDNLNAHMVTHTGDVTCWP